MEELQDAIEDAQYVTAITSVEDGPRPMVTWEIPDASQLAEWKERVIVMSSRKNDSPPSPTPFEYEWTLSHAIGFFLFSAYLKESVGDYVQINFMEEVLRWKATRGRLRAEKTSFIVANYLSVSSMADAEPSGTTPPSGESVLAGASPSQNDTENNHIHSVESTNKIVPIIYPPKTQIVEYDLAREPTNLLSEEIQEIRARNSGTHRTCIGVGGKVLDLILSRVEKLRNSPGYEALLKMHSENGNKISDRSVSKGQATMRSLSLVSHQLPATLFDEAEIVVADDVREKHWAGFQSSEYHAKMLNFLWFQDRTVVEEDFFIIRILGRGGFGLVHACKKGTSGKLYAMKVMSKRRIKQKKAEQLTLNERQCLADINSPFVVNLKYAFQSKMDVFLILDLMTGGDLSFHLGQKGRFSNAQCLYYAARIVLGLQALHDQGYVYRDLKPENCLLGEDGRVKLTDLGLAIKVTPNLHGAAGTRGYWAPEMLRKNEKGSRMNYGKMVDWFSFGCCLAEFISGTNPFRSQTALNFGLEKGSKTKEKAIDCATLEMNPEFDSKKFNEDATDICQRLLDKNETTRLGANGCDEIMSHPWFSDVNWEDIISDRMLPPFIPPKDVNAASQSDIGAFVDDKTYRETVLSDADEAIYENWNFTNTKAFEAEVIEFLIYERETGKPLLPIQSSMLSRQVLPILLILLTASNDTTALQFSTDEVGTNGFQDDPLVFIDRMYVPYGPNLVSTPKQTDQPWNGYAYGMGATEHWAYDHKEKYIYSQSEAGGYITVIDWSTLPGTVTPYSMDVCGENCDVRDIVVCPEQGLLLMTRTDRNDVLVYATVKRSHPKTPSLLEEINAGNAPDALRLSNDCKILAVANVNEGTDLINLGSVTLVTNFWPTDSAATVTQSVSLASFNEEYLLERDVHLPLTKNSAIYWNSAADDGTTYGWEEEGGVIENFNPAIVLSPEFLIFNEDGSELFINLQYNSALVRVNTATGEAISIDGFGLKSFGSSSNGVDVVKDGECKLVKNDCLYLAKNPDAIATVLYDGVDYILTADEGSDFGLGDFEEKRDSTELFGEGATFLYNNFTFDESFFVPGDSTAGCSANFQADCEANLEAGLVDWCSDMEITIGSSAVDFSVANAPVMSKIIGFGGRGIGIYKLGSDPTERMVQVFDSASQFEEETCAQFEWAHNSLMDEEFAPACEEDNISEESCPAWILADEDLRSDISDKNNPEEDGCESTGGACPMAETVDEKAQEDGIGVESVSVGIACGRLVALACGENNSMCFLYDITDIENPLLVKTFHLSDVSKTKNPAQSYRKDLGDIDAESVLWIPPSRSPNGKSGFLFGGAISGTLSFYEFQCLEAEDKCFPDGCDDAAESDSTSSSSSSTKSLSTEAIALIAVGSVVAVGLAAFALSRSLKRSGSGVVSEGNSGKGDFA